MHAAKRRRGSHQQAVVRADEDSWLLLHGECDSTPRSPDAGIDDREVDPRRRVGKRGAEHERAGADIMAGHAVAEIDDSRGWAAPGDHAMADADELVAVAVVGEEGDERAHYAGPLAAAASAISASSKPTMSCRVASMCGSRPCSRSVALVTGPIEAIRVCGPGAALWRKKRTVEDEVNVR